MRTSQKKIRAKKNGRIVTGTLEYDNCDVVGRNGTPYIRYDGKSAYSIPCLGVVIKEPLSQLEDVEYL